MYTLADRMKAVNLYLKYDRNAAAVRRELGYPSKRSLRQWVDEFAVDGSLHAGYRSRPPKYSPAQKQAAVNYYLEHGRSLVGVIRALSYPNRYTLAQWLEAAGARESRVLTAGVGGDRKECTPEQKRAAVLDLLARKGPAQTVASQHGASRAALYKWGNDLFGKGNAVSKRKRSQAAPWADKDALAAKVRSLQEQVGALEEQVNRLRLEKDVLEATAEILKKGQGADPRQLTNREKTVVIGAQRDLHPLNELLEVCVLAKSSYFYQCTALAAEDKYAGLRTQLHRIFADAAGRYGYRRVHAMLRRCGQPVSEKVVRRLMREEGLVVIAQKKRKYSSYQGEISPEVPNLLERDFQADAPNRKWLTDRTEFAIPAGKVYLSPLIDCLDGLVVSWSIGTRPDAKLVNSMMGEGIATLPKGDHPVVHNDRGAHYRWPDWISPLGAAGLTRSMSKKGCSPDNAACEGFFGRLKNEMFYGRSWQGVSIEEFMERLNQYLHWYNNDRIKMSLGARSPMEYRRSLGYA